ncbi:MAG: DegV family protein [Clostridia bacterium]|nr:DegV family protein [Clostridia bacterium]MBQ8399150.1 DegV family protein [Clostridia bacterium]
MRTFQIITDSAMDLTPALVEETKVDVLPLVLTIEEKDYLNYPDEREITCTDFYNRMRGGAVGTTAACSVGKFEETFRAYAKEGKDVLYLGFSSGLSATWHNGHLAAKTVMEEYPERKILTVDSLCASMGGALFVYLVAKKADEGADIETVHAYATDLVQHICHTFTVEDLVYLKRGGRVSAATALVGGLLNIKPVLHVDSEGHLVSIGKTRGRKASIAALSNYIKGRELPETPEVAYICHGDCIEDAQLLSDLIQKEYGFKKVVIGYTGPVIGAHSGPGTLALFFVGGNR